MTLEERKMMASAFMEQQYRACLYELNLKPSELMKITLNVLRRQGPVFDDNFIVVERDSIDSIKTSCCPILGRSTRT